MSVAACKAPPPLSISFNKRKGNAEDSSSPKKVKRSDDHEKFSSSSEEESSDGDRHSIDANTPLSATSVGDSTSPALGRPKRFVCTYPDCGKRFNRPVRLEEHIRSHTNTRPFVCPHEPCTKDFLRKTHLNHHIKSVHSEIRDYMCTYLNCGKAFATGSRLKRHCEAHVERDKYRCAEEGCGATFRKQETLARHKLTVHEGKSAFRCDELKGDGSSCGQTFDRAHNLKLHRERHHNEERYICTACPPIGGEDPKYLSFVTHNELQAHTRTVHPPKCSVCGHKTRSARELEKHMATKHSEGAMASKDAAVHHCPEKDCGRTFIKPAWLTAHLENSHGIFPPPQTEQIDIVAKVTAMDLEQKSGPVAHMNDLKDGRSGRKKRSKGPKKQKPSMIDLLTGTAMSADPARKISCLLAPDCDFVFWREHDRFRHMQARHGLAEVEIHNLEQGLPRNHIHDDDDLDNDRMRVTDGALLGDVEDDMMEVDPQLSELGLEARLENGAINGGVFWVGGLNDDYD